MLNKDVLYDKIYGCWLGKNIGGTLGTPPEGQKTLKKPLAYEFPKGCDPNDDLDLQLVWLDMLKRKGLALTKEDFSEAWINHISYPYDEYGIGRANLIRGLRSPESGTFNNYFSTSMGCPIRSEIWGCIAAGRPATAAALARFDGEVDHGTESVYAEMFFAAMEALAFVKDDPLEIIFEALDYLPVDCDIFRAVRQVIDAHKAGQPLSELRLDLIAKYDRGNFTDCRLNIAFTIAGILYENQDFLRTMVTAINLGYDTDCTGATSGAFIGILLGAKRIREMYDVEFDNRIVSGWGVFDIYVPPTIEQFTRDCIELNDQLDNMANAPAIPKHFTLPSVDVSKISLKRSYRIGAFASLAEATAAADTLPVISGPVDYFTLDRYVQPGKRLYLFAKVKADEKEIRIAAQSNCEAVTYMNGKEIARIPAGDFAPSPHRHWGSIQKISFSGEESIAVELIPCKGSIVDFQLMVGLEKGLFPLPYFTIEA